MSFQPSTWPNPTRCRRCYIQSVPSWRPLWHVPLWGMPGTKMPSPALPHYWQCCKTQLPVHSENTACWYWPVPYLCRHILTSSFGVNKLLHQPGPPSSPSCQLEGSSFIVPSGFASAAKPRLAQEHPLRTQPTPHDWQCDGYKGPTLSAQQGWLWWTTYAPELPGAGGGAADACLHHHSASSSAQSCPLPLSLPSPLPFSSPPFPSLGVNP